MAITITEQLACVERELRMRRRVYGRWVQQKKLTAEKADHELAAMQAVWDSLCELSAWRSYRATLGVDLKDFNLTVEETRAAARSGQDVSDVQPALFMRRFYGR